MSDDTTLVGHGKGPFDAKNEAQSLFEEAKEWFKANGVVLNDGKTQERICTLGKTCLDAAPVTVLGFDIDNKLSFEQHINKCLTATSGTASFSGDTTYVRDVLQKKALRTLTKSDFTAQRNQIHAHITRARANLDIPLVESEWREIDRRFRMCPFDESHIISIERYHYHIVRCHKKHQSNKIRCPFDASEYIDPDKMTLHILNCKKRELLISSEEFNHHHNSSKPQPKENTIESTESEDWDPWDDFSGVITEQQERTMNASKGMKESISRAYSEEGLMSLGRGRRGSGLINDNDEDWTVGRTLGRGASFRNKPIPPVASSNSALSPWIPLMGSSRNQDEKIEKDTQKRESNVEEKKVDQRNLEPLLESDSDTDEELEASFRRRYTDITFSKNDENDHQESKNLIQKLQEADAHESCSDVRKESPKNEETSNAVECQRNSDSMLPNSALSPWTTRMVFSRNQDTSNHENQKKENDVEAKQIDCKKLEPLLKSDSDTDEEKEESFRRHYTDISFSKNDGNDYHESKNLIQKLQEADENESSRSNCVRNKSPKNDETSNAVESQQNSNSMLPNHSALRSRQEQQPYLEIDINEQLKRIKFKSNYSSMKENYKGKDEGVFSDAECDSQDARDASYSFSSSSSSKGNTVRQTKSRLLEFLASSNDETYKPATSQS